MSGSVEQSRWHQPESVRGERRRGCVDSNDSHAVYVPFFQLQLTYSKGAAISVESLYLPSHTTGRCHSYGYSSTPTLPETTSQVVRDRHLLGSRFMLHTKLDTARCVWCTQFLFVDRNGPQWLSVPTTLSSMFCVPKS